MKRAVSSALLLLLAGCQMATRQVRPEPLESEGEVVVYLQPVQGAADRLSLVLESVAIARGEGVPAPLDLKQPELPAGEMPRQRLLARGRVSPGPFSALLVKFRRARLGAPDSGSDMLVPAEPVRVPVNFTVARGRGTVLHLTLDGAASIEAEHDFNPRLAATLSRMPLMELLGFVSASASLELTVFDKNLRQVVGVVPTGRDPRGLAVDGRSGRLYVALGGDNQVQAFDVPTGAELGRLRLQAGDRPRELALTPDGRILLVMNQGSNSVAFADAGSLIENTRIPVGNDPVALLLDPGGRWAWVFNRGSSSITVIDVASRSVARTVSSDPEPIRGQLSRDGTRLLVAHAGSPFLTVLSVPDYRVAGRIHVGSGTTGLRVDPRTGLTYVAKGPEQRLDIYDAAASLAIGSIVLPAAGSLMALDDAFNVLYVVLPRASGVAAIDVASRRTLPLIETGGEPYQVVVVGERR